MKKSGLATRAELEELHRLTVAALTERLKASPSGEHLAVSRAMLKDNGQRAWTDKERAALRKLYRLLLAAFLEAMNQEGPPSAALLAEVRHFLHSQGISQDIGGAIDEAQALTVLGSAALPFNETKH